MPKTTQQPNSPTTSPISPGSSVLALLAGTHITPAMVESAEQNLLDLPQVDCPVVHRHGPGLYFREVQMPAGTFAIGHHQNYAQWNLFLQGRVTVIQDDGSLVELVAPMSFLGAPGRKVGYVHEDVVWVNVYASDETDVEKLEAQFLTKSDTWQLSAAANHAFARMHRQADRDDFAAAIAELGYSMETVRSQSEFAGDQIPMPSGHYKVKVGPSSIEGRGMFATADIAEGETIAPARIGGKRTPAGRYTNHARQPNACMRISNADGDVELVALRRLRGCAGGRDGDEITVDYRQANKEIMDYQREKSCQE
jgi:hypothetical protein